MAKTKQSPNVSALETHLRQNVGRLFTYSNANALCMISGLLLHEHGDYYYSYYSLESGKSFNAPCHLFGAGYRGDVIWLTPVKTVDKSET